MLNLFEPPFSYNTTITTNKNSPVYSPPGPLPSIHRNWDLTGHFNDIFVHPWTARVIMFLERKPAKYQYLNRSEDENSVEALDVGVCNEGCWDSEHLQRGHKYGGGCRGARNPHVHCPTQVTDHVHAVGDVGYVAPSHTRTARMQSANVEQTIIECIYHACFCLSPILVGEPKNAPHIKVEIRIAKAAEILNILYRRVKLQ